MTHGKLSREQAFAVRRFVRNREVHDLGCGPYFHHAATLVELGAKRVVGVDELYPEHDEHPPGSVYVCTTFEHFKGDIDVAFLSWPVNRPVPGLLSLVASARTIIYLGSNTSGNACGTPRLFRTLVQRQVVAHIPERRNTLIVYGKTISKQRKPLLEEQAGMDHEQMYYFEEGR